MIRRSFAAVVVVSALLIGVVGSSQASTSRSSSRATAHTSSSCETLCTVLKTHVLNVATEEGIPGYEQIGANGKPKGFDIDIIKNIAASLGAKAKFTYVGNAARIGALQSGKVQMVVANFTVTPQRASVITFSDPYINEHSELAVKAGSRYHTVAQLNKPSTTVCLEQGGYTPSVITAVFSKIKQFKTFNNISDCAAALQAGKVDAMAQDQFDLGELLKAHPGSIKIIPNSFFLWELEGIGIQNNDQPWLNWLNQWVYGFVNSPLESQFFQKNFGFAMPASANDIRL